jgi:glycosyltransferase involved in cell wall biosynthesis
VKTSNKTAESKDNLVSVIIPTYNRADFITQSLNSVWEQIYRPIEVIVVDDGSVDNTEDVVNKWAENHNDRSFSSKYIYQENGGAPAARNNGIKNATGRYLQFLDSDDVLMPEKLALQIELLKKENTPFCICDYIHIDHAGNVIRTSDNNRSIEEIIKSYKWLHTSIGVINKACFKEDILKWNPRLMKNQDRDFNLKILFVIEKFSYVNKPLFKWVRHNGKRIFNSQLTRNIYWDSLKSLLKFNIIYWRSISAGKSLSILYLYRNLLFKLSGYIYASYGMAEKIPESLKFWHYFR